MQRFERFRRAVGLSLEQGARLWAEGIHSPEEFLERAVREDGREGLRGLLRMDACRLEALLRTASSLSDEGDPPVAAIGTRSGAADQVRGIRREGVERV